MTKNAILFILFNMVERLSLSSDNPTIVASITLHKFLALECLRYKIMPNSRVNWPGLHCSLDEDLQKNTMNLLWAGKYVDIFVVLCKCICSRK
jgi:hypothetical protein